MFRVCMGNQGEDAEEPSELMDEPFIIPEVPILAEVVGATNLKAAMAGKNRRKSLVMSTPDAHCVLRLVGGDAKKNEVVHKTDVIYKNESPIFTVKTRSLCILHIPDSLHDKKSEKKPDNVDASSIYTSSSVPSTPESSDESPRSEPTSFLVVEVYNGKKCLGKVQISCEHILKCQGAREEYLIREESSQEGMDEQEEGIAGSELVQQMPTLLANSQQNQKALLALRFRPANQEDIQFLSNIERRRSHSRIGSSAQFVTRSLTRSATGLVIDAASIWEPSQEVEATDLSFKRVMKKSLFSSYRKKDERSGQVLYRLQPPNRDLRPLDQPVEWATKSEIEKNAAKPSWKWVETGHGEAGTLLLEVIGCDNLPNLDVGPGDLTDPFIACVFEDNIVRTKVLFDTLHPRWMPWSTRAFAFNVTHPGSNLFIGVFDYDDDFVVADYHDPVGRIVINTINFESGVSYLLHYDLINSAQMDKPRGTITIRLRVVWKDENEAAKLAVKAPPPFIINVESMKSWHVLHYCLHGGINMDKASIASVKSYAAEVASYWWYCCYCLDVLTSILLWRGRAKLSLTGYSFNIWFPIQSLWLFASVVIAFEKPHLRAAIFFYGLAWIMISTNYHGSRHPYPWYRVKKLENFVLGLIPGLSPSGPPSSTIKANENAIEKSHYDALNKLRADRMAALISALINTGLKAASLYSGTNLENFIKETEDPTFHFLSNTLYYPHLALQSLCRQARALRNFICWQSYGAFRTTLNFLLLGILCNFGPFRLATTWAARIWIWGSLGPFMKLVDMIWIHDYFKTSEELLDDIINDRQDNDFFFLPLFDEIVEHDFFHSMRNAGRIVAEEASKLGDIRDCVHGPLSERVPAVDNSRKFSYPKPHSSAKPCGTELETPDDRALNWKFVPGKRMEGSMVMQRPGPPPNSRSLRVPETKKNQ